MIIPQTPRARAILAAAVENLFSVSRKLDQDQATTRKQRRHAMVAAASKFFRELPSADRSLLIAAKSSDVFRTALRAWFHAADPGLAKLKRAGLVALVALQAKRFLPSIERAQVALKALK